MGKLYNCNKQFPGRLFKAKDLELLAKYMLLFYQEQPVDWLIRQVFTLNKQNMTILYPYFLL